MKYKKGKDKQTPKVAADENCYEKAKKRLFIACLINWSLPLQLTRCIFQFVTSLTIFTERGVIVTRSSFFRWSLA